SRPRVGNKAEITTADELMSSYIDQYRAELRFRGRGEPLRSPRLQELGQTIGSVASSHVLETVLDKSLVSPVTSTGCGGTANNAPLTALRLIAHLITHPKQRAMHCCYVDSGLITADGGGGYDTHQENCHTQARNLRNTLAELLSHVRKPDENGPEAEG